MATDLKDVLRDPDYQKLHESEKIKVWSHFEPSFAALAPDEQLRVLRETSAPAMPGTLPADIMTGLGRSLTKGVKGAAQTALTAGRLIAGGPSGQRQVLSDIGDIITQPGLESAAKADIAKGRPNLAAFRRSFGRVPIAGPWAASTAENIMDNPAQGISEAVGDVGQVFAGRMIGKTGKLLGEADAPPPPGPIPGAAPMAIETQATGPAMMARMLGKSPLGIKSLVDAVRSRNITTKAAAQELMGGPPSTMEQAGGAAISGVRTARNAAEAAENAAWNPLKASIAEQGITVPLTRTTELAKPEYLQGMEAHKALASNLSPSTQKVLTQLHKRTAASEDMMNQLPPMAMGQPISEFLASGSPEAQQLMEGISAAAEPPPPWSAVHQARTEIGQLRKKSEIAAPLGSNTRTALSKIYDGLTTDLTNALADTPELQEQFANASLLTKSIKTQYGTKGTLTKAVMANPGVPASKIVGRVLNGGPEDARQFVKSMGNDQAAKLALVRGVMGKLLDEATGRRFNEPGAILNGPSFAAAYLKNRPVIEAIVPNDLLARWDGFADTVRKFETTKGGEGTWGRIASLAEAGTMAVATMKGVQALGHLAAGEGAKAGASATGAAQMAVPLIAGRKLVNIMLQPEGPGLYARYMQTGKWAPELSNLAEKGAYIGVLAPPPSANK